VAEPVIETPRLLLRGWQAEDVAPYAALLADPETARFVTRRGLPCGRAEAWAETAFLIGHWQLRGFGLFVIEARATGAFLGRAGPLQPEGWPGIEIAWALTPEARGQGYATEAAAASAAWTFRTFGPDHLVSLIHPDNGDSQRVAVRLGECRTEDSFAPFGEACDIWRLDPDRLRHPDMEN
jgi:RimJ/RimL family protein N-acetyltransferase